jgi:hypothetical protein
MEKMANYKKRLDWENELNNSFMQLNFKDDLIPLMRKCYELATSDIGPTLEYTDVVLENIAIITNKETMEMTFKQYKSFNAYINSYTKNNRSVNVNKLYINE